MVAAQLRCNFILACEQSTHVLEQFTYTYIELLMVCALLVDNSTLAALGRYSLGPSVYKIPA